MFVFECPVVVAERSSRSIFLDGWRAIGRSEVRGVTADEEAVDDVKSVLLGVGTSAVVVVVRDEGAMGVDDVGGSEHEHEHGGGGRLRLLTWPGRRRRRRGR